MLSALFAHPWILAGLIAVGIPALIEWLFRRRRRKVELPSLRYLLKHKDQKNIKRQDRLLLLLRTLACLLIVLAIARPVVRATASTNSSKQIVLLMDGTASMNQQVGTTTSFGLARKKAADILRSVNDGARATVGVFSQGVDAIAEGESDLKVLSDLVEGLRAAEGADAACDGLEWVKAVLAKNSDMAADIYIFSDFQKYTWLRNGEVTRRTSALLGELSARNTVFFADVGGKIDFNYLVTRLTPRDPLVAASMPVKFDARVELRGNAPGTNATVTFLINNEKKDVRQIGGTTDLTFDYQFPEAGEYVVSVEVEGDNYRLDNSRYYLCSVPQDVRVLILDDTAEETGLAQESFFLKRAIAPEIKPGIDRVSAFAVTVRPPARAAYENFGDYAMVLLAGTEKLDDALANKLHLFAQDGGAVGLFPGPAVNYYDYNKKLWRDGKGLLPCELAAPGAAEGKWNLSFAAMRDPAVAILSSGGAQNLFPVTTFLPLRIDAKAEGAVELARIVRGADEHLPGIVARPFGRGRAVFFNFTAGTRWSPFPASVDFALLLQEMLRALAGNPDAGVNLECGQEFQERVLVSDQYLLLKSPNGKRHRTVPSKTTAGGEQTWKIAFGDTRYHGLYEVDTVPEVMRRRRFVANLRTEEGDLELNKDEVASSLGAAGMTWVSPDGSFEEIIARRHSVTELSAVILWLLVILLAGESLLAALFGRRRKAKA